MTRAPKPALLLAGTLLIALVVAGALVAQRTDAQESRPDPDPDDALREVSFDQIVDDWVVEVDGLLVEVGVTERDARDLAGQHKLAQPRATVLYQRRSVFRAALVTAPSTPEPSPTAATPLPLPPTPPAPPTASAPTPTSAPTSTAPTPVPANGELVWGPDPAAPSDTWAQPAVNQSYTDPAYGSTVRRLTSADGTRFNRNTYSRRQAENADGTLFFTYHGEAEYRVYNIATTELVRILDLNPDAEPQWHPTDPNRLRYLAGANSYTGELALYEVNIETGFSTVIADLTDRLAQQLPGALYMIDRAEGSPSADGNHYAWIVYDDAEDPIGIVSYDLATDTILGTGPLRTDVQNLDWVSASPSGRYVMAGYWDATFVYDADLSDERLVFAGGEHSDIALNSAGNDSYVYIDFTAGPNGGWLVATDLVTLEETRIFDLYDDANTSIHISGKGYDKPGWVVVSTYSCKEPAAWSCHKVMAVELQPNGRILNLAHTYNCGDDYWTETHAVVNRSFTRVYFNTDSGSCGIDAEVMEVLVPAFS